MCRISLFGTWESEFVRQGLTSSAVSPWCCVSEPGFVGGLVWLLKREKLIREKLIRGFLWAL